MAATKAKPKKGVKPLKKKKVVKAQPIEDALQNFREITQARYRIAKATYEAQDSLTQEVIDRIRDRLRIAATGVVNINGKPFKLEQQYIDFNIWFIATEILSDLALNDIQIANFQFHPAWCAECKREITGVPMEKGKKIGRPKGRR